MRLVCCGDGLMIWCFPIYPGGAGEAMMVAVQSVQSVQPVCVQLTMWLSVTDGAPPCTHLSDQRAEARVEWWWLTTGCYELPVWWDSCLSWWSLRGPVCSVRTDPQLWWHWHVWGRTMARRNCEKCSHCWTELTFCNTDHTVQSLTIRD